MQQHKYDTIIVGAGAAGLMCAYIASDKGKKVAILDHSHKLAEKIRISGGGRCNFTNIYTHPNKYLSHNPHFCISPLSRYTPEHFCDLLDQYNITYHEKTLGQLFCNNSAEDIINLFDYLCQQRHVQRMMEIKIIHIEQHNLGFTVTTNIGILYSETLVIATGGLSIPKIGASGWGYTIAKQFNLNVVPTSPALVPLTIPDSELHSLHELSGTSFFSDVSIGKIHFEEKSLITHRGLSGPAILQISSYWHQGQAIKINLLPNINIGQVLLDNQQSNKLLSNFLHQFFTERLSLMLAQLSKVNKKLNQLNKADILHIHKCIHELMITPSGTLGYQKAEVTKGGIDTTYLSSQTMAVRDNPSLFFIGEVVDVTGHLGGYNFQWAWSSAYVCGRHI